MSPTAQAAEQPLLFELHGDTLLGVLHAADPGADLGLLVVVGGPQYRGGSHRQFVQLARTIAAQGVPVLRFDVRGMGDSTGDVRGFEDLSNDIGAAIDALQQARPGLRRVVLWGLCDGASAALLYLHERRDSRVAGLVLLNPWVRTQATQALTTVKHYYRRRLREREFWQKLLTGRVAGQALRSLLANLRAAWSQAPAARAGAGDEDGGDYTQRMQRAWQRFDKPILLVLSGNDYTAKEFLERAASDPGWQRNLAMPVVTRLDLPGADHTFSTLGSAPPVEQATLDMLRRLTQRAPAEEAQAQAISSSESITS